MKKAFHTNGMKKRVLIITAAAVLALLAVRAALLFVTFAVETRELSAAACGRADAIVVLTGGKNRAEEGLKLLKSGSASIMVLSGVNRDADLDAIFLNRLTNAERANIILDKESTSTYQNAIEARGIMKKMGLTSMLLITSGYHIKRAEYIFSKIMPEEVNIVPCAVSTPNFDIDKWWGGNSLLIIFVEFVKYYLFVAGFYLGVI
ncbi:MAG: YdcF family protein [Deltaproteobacteria bacterium]|nr:YdcF family protein [Deltaproteobacteria bacterium]